MLMLTAFRQGTLGAHIDIKRFTARTLDLDLIKLPDFRQQLITASALDHLHIVYRLLYTRVTIIAHKSPKKVQIYNQLI